MSYLAYRLMHVAGIAILLTTVGAMGLHARHGPAAENPVRRLLQRAHGLALLLIIVGGFGMLARLGLLQAGVPGWVWIKLGIWLVFGAIPALAYRRRAYAMAVLVLAPILLLAAGATALLKPFA